MSQKRPHKSQIANRKSQMRRGSAMSEFVLVLPFLIFFLALTLYFGRGVLRVQRDQVMDRYEAWREAGGGRGPAPDDRNQHWQLNQTFYMGHAARIGYGVRDDLPTDAPDQWVAKAKDASDNAGRTAQEAADRFARGVTVQTTAAHTETVPLWKPIDRPITHHHTRLNTDWRHANGQWYLDPHGDWEPGDGGPWMLDPVTRDTFFSTFDGDLRGYGDGGNFIATAVRDLYRQRPGYVGPTEGLRWP
jgi:hypothetical protein